MTKTWEVLSLVMPEFSHICEVSGVLCCCDVYIHVRVWCGEFEVKQNRDNGGFPGRSSVVGDGFFYTPMVGWWGVLYPSFFVRSENHSIKVGLLCLYIEFFPALIFSF